MSAELTNDEEVKVIAARYVDRPKTDPNARSFVIKDHIIADPEKLRSGRMYVGDAFRAVVITLMPGQGQKTHMHPSTDHAWFVVSGTAEMVMEDGKKSNIGPGHFVVHPRNTVHGLKNNTQENFVYIALSTGD